jgi:hypothetical protein
VVTVHSLLSVTTPASSLQLLTIEQMREAAGITGSGSDILLTAMGLRLAAAVTTECCVAVGAGAPPTLLRETLTETYRMVYAPVIALSRRHEVEITSVTVDGVAVDPVDYVVDPESGLLTRLSGDDPISWQARKVVVVYAAGFDTVPGDLAMSMMDFFRLAWLERGRDPMVKSERTDVPGVMERERQYWVGSVPGQSNEGAVPDVVAGQLARFRNFSVG